MLHAIISDLRAGVPIPKMAARFHNGVAQMAVQVCLAMRSHFGVNEVALSGGVWQNISLLQKTIPLLEKNGFTVYIHQQVPANDGGLSLGQAVIAAHQLPE
ncbi:MAG: hypothetical protein KJ638_08090 [Chloroflexi bacterium]|nr:hypothetical protein [Chloroflexota bacterium]